jgi:hypothetical protein
MELLYVGEPVPQDGAFAILGAQGARLQDGVREPSYAGNERASIAAGLVFMDPESQGAILNFAGYGKYSGGGPEPTSYAETEAAAHERRIRTWLGRVGLARSNWTIMSGAKDSGFNAAEFAGSTVEEAILVTGGLRRIAQDRGYTPPLTVIAGPKHLQRIEDVFRAMKDAPEVRFGLVSHTEDEGAMATVTRWVYKALVLRGARNSLTPEKLLAREAATVGRIFAAKEAVTSFKSFVKEQRAHTQAA